MLITLLGYMGSGKTEISKKLGKILNLQVIDLDDDISQKENKTITEIFEKKGELYFRKVEKKILETILSQNKNAILSVGGGTPAYYDNIDLINKNSISIYLSASVGTLANRLSKEKLKRPLIAQISDAQLAEYIAKHIFERNAYYSKAKIKINTDNKNPEKIAKEIVNTLQELSISSKNESQ